MKEQEYENSYERRRELLWRDVKEKDDLGYPNIINYFCKRKQNHKENSYVEFKPPVEHYDKSYDLSLVIRLMGDKILLKKRTKLPSGAKKRITPRKDFLNMKEYEKYAWISLINEVRYATLNGEGTILLSNKEIKLIGG